MTDQTSVQANNQTVNLFPRATEPAGSKVRVLYARLPDQEGTSSISWIAPARHGPGPPIKPRRLFNSTQAPPRRYPDRRSPKEKACKQTGTRRTQTIMPKIDHLRITGTKNWMIDELVHMSRTFSNHTSDTFSLLLTYPQDLGPLIGRR